MKIAIVHDLAECITGDIVPEKYSGISENDKHKMERDAIEKILALLWWISLFWQRFTPIFVLYEHLLNLKKPDKESRDHIRELYDEYENQTTPGLLKHSREFC